MDILKRNKLPFGISCCYTSRNADVIGSEEYFDQMVDWGAKFAWFFTYMPVGKNAVPELMVSADQRAFMYRRIREFRHSKPILHHGFSGTDGEFVGGCIAGARSYLHINAAGDIEPCAFIHYADSNIREKTLLEAYKSPLFMAYHKISPSICNHLRPCPCWTTRTRSSAWYTSPAPGARTSRPPRTWTSSRTSAARRPKSGPSRPVSSGRRATRRLGVSRDSKSLRINTEGFLFVLVKKKPLRLQRRPTAAGICAARPTVGSLR